MDLEGEFILIDVDWFRVVLGEGKVGGGDCFRAIRTMC